MTQPVVNEVPMATMAAPAPYPSIDNMTTQNAEVNTAVDQNQHDCNKNNEDSGSFLLRLRGGGGCITDCLAAIGCCCVCEECCC